MTKLHFDLPMYSFLLECPACKHQSIADARVWDAGDSTHLYKKCLHCSSDGHAKYHIVLDVKLVKDHLPLFIGEANPNSATTYAIKFIKTGGWIPYGYSFFRKSNYGVKTNWGTLEYLPLVQKLDKARIFYTKRSVKATITRYVNRSSSSSSSKLRREDFEVYEILSQPVQKVII